MKAARLVLWIEVVVGLTLIAATVYGAMQLARDPIAATGGSSVEGPGAGLWILGAVVILAYLVPVTVLVLTLAWRVRSGRRNIQVGALVLQVVFLLSGVYWAVAKGALMVREPTAYSVTVFGAIVVLGVIVPVLQVVLLARRPAREYFAPAPMYGLS